MTTRSAVMKKHSSFMIYGDWLTDFVKQRVIEGRWDHALETLQCLEGITIEQALRVLKGEAKLTGDSVQGINIEEDWDTQYTEDLKYHFAGCYVDSNGRYLRPYAFVTSWGIEDYDHGDKVTKGSGSILDRRGKEKMGCSLFYADDPQRDVAKIVRFERKNNNLGGLRKDGTSIVLFREVPNYPFQIIKASGLERAQNAMDNFMAADLYPKEVGYINTYPPQIYKIRYDVDDPAECRPNSFSTDIDASNDDGEYGLKKLGQFRFDKVSAENAGMTIEEWQDYQARMQGKENVVDQHSRMLEQADAAHESFEKNQSEYFQEILNQAKDNWLVLGTIDNKEVKIPRAPFENWCLWRGDGAHLALPWTPVCPSGLKMFGDDPYHTDFLIGGGFDLNAMDDSNNELSQLVWDARHKVQEEKMGFKVAVLCGTGQTGTLKSVHPQKGEECKPDEVAIIPNAGPNYVAAAMTAGAVICEQGGAMAHLVTVSREKNVKIVRVEKARQIYPVGMHLEVDCSAGEVRVPFNRIDYKMKLGGQIINISDIE